MLCPKCGFISFDHLAACGKCHNDLTGIGASLHGTAVDVESRFFLGSALKEEAPVARETQPDMVEEESSAIDMSQEEDQSAIELAELEDVPQEETAQDALEGVAITADEPPALEFDLEEIALVDSPANDPAEPEDSAMQEEEGHVEETEVTLLDFGKEDVGDQETISLSEEEEPMTDGESLGIDASSLTLDSFEEEANQSAASDAPEGDEQPEQLTIDLNAIDLSDLVHGQSGASPSREETVSAEGGGGLDFEDAMDLSLFVGETHEVPSADSDQYSMDKGLEPIDLSLVDEALVDLAVDPGRQEHSPIIEESHSDILELSMEDSKEDDSK